MSYGHPIPSGHGRRVPAYRWSPTVLPPSQRRARRGRNACYGSSVPRFRFTTPGRHPSVGRPSRNRPQRAVAPRESSFGKLLWKGVASLTEGTVKFLAEEAVAGRRTTKSFESFLAFLIVLAVMASSAIGLVLGAFYLFVAYMDDFAGGAAAESIEEYDETKKRMGVNRKASVEAPPRPDEMRRAWEAARGRGSLAAKLLAGTLLSNLEPAVDQSYLRAEDGTIVGRRPGLKGWLRGYCPDLVPHYKALMGYKALADKLRIALGIEEPDTLSSIIDFGEMAGNVGVEPSGAALPCGDAAPGGGSKKDEEEVLDGRGAKDAGGVAKDGRMNQKALRLRKSFGLQTTNEKLVVEAIQSLFAAPELGTGAMGKTGKGPGVRTRKGTAGKIAKTSVFAAGIDETGLSQADEGARSNEGPWGEDRARGEVGPQGAIGPMTMAALEAAVRERLGLCWMRRRGLRSRTNTKIEPSCPSAGFAVACGAP